MWILSFLHGTYIWVKKFKVRHQIFVYIRKNSYMSYKQTILYSQYILGRLQFAEVKPGKFGIVR